MSYTSAIATTIIFALFPGCAARAGSLRLVIDRDADVANVGALNRWDQDGNPRTPVDPQARIDQPGWSATATQSRPREWLFVDLPAGRYDLVIILRDQVRIEGFHYPAVLEFDAWMSHGEDPGDETREAVTTAITQSRHYENKVAPLYLAGNADCVRVLVQLLRDQPTSYDAEYGQPVATLRHEIWQFTQQYGAWSKEKRTRVLDRLLMAKADLQKWTWVWAPELGGIEVSTGSEKVVRFQIPRKFPADNCRGLTALPPH